MHINYLYKEANGSTLLSTAGGLLSAAGGGGAAESCDDGDAAIVVVVVVVVVVAVAAVAAVAVAVGLLPLAVVAMGSSSRFGSNGGVISPFLTIRWVSSMCTSVFKVQTLKHVCHFQLANTNTPTYLTAVLQH